MSLRRRLDKIEADATDTTPEMHVAELHDRDANVSEVPGHIHAFTDRAALDTWAASLPAHDTAVLIDMRTTPAPDLS